MRAAYKNVASVLESFKVVGKGKYFSRQGAEAQRKPLKTQLHIESLRPGARNSLGEKVLLVQN